MGFYSYLEEQGSIKPTVKPVAKSPISATPKKPITPKKQEGSKEWWDRLSAEKQQEWLRSNPEGSAKQNVDTGAWILKSKDQEDVKQKGKPKQGEIEPSTLDDLEKLLDFDTQERLTSIANDVVNNGGKIPPEYLEDEGIGQEKEDMYSQAAADYVNNGTPIDDITKSLKKTPAEEKAEKEAKEKAEKEVRIKDARDTSYVPKTYGEIANMKEEDVLRQGNWDEYRDTMEKNLTEIRGETPKPKYTKVSGKLDNKDTKAMEQTVASIEQNMMGELESYEGYLHENAEKPAKKFVSSFKSIIEDGIKDGSLANIDAEEINKLAVDCMQKLMHQEKEATRVDYTDHGFRHIVGNHIRQKRISKLLDKKVSGKEQLMGMFIMANHDMGYSTPIGRTGGDVGGMFSGEHHKTISAHLAEQQREDWDVGKIFSAEEYNVINEIIKTHDDTTLSPNIPSGYANLANSIKISDNLSMYNTEKLPSIFKYIPNGERKLIKLGEIASRLKGKASERGLSKGEQDTYDNWIKEKDPEKKLELEKKLPPDMISEAKKDVEDFEVFKTKMSKSIEDDDKIDERLRRDIKAGLETIRPDTPKYTLGVLAGHVQKMYKGKDGRIYVEIQHNKLDYATRDFHPDKVSEQKARSFFKDSGYKKDDAFDGNITEFDLGRGKDGTGQNMLRVILTGAPKREDRQGTPKKANEDSRFEIYLENMI